MELNFTVNCTLDIPNQSYTAQIGSVVTPHGEDITKHFLDYCAQASLPLTSEEEIRAAAYAYGKKFYP